VTPQASLAVADVDVAYPNGVIGIKDASVALEGGTICALAGPNGAGKSTLFKAIMGLLRPSRGSIAINGLPVMQALRQKLVAYVPQADHVDWNFPILVEDVVMMGRYGHMNVLRTPRQPDRAAVAAQAPDRRTLGRAEAADVHRPRARPGQPHHSLGRAVHGRRRQDRGADHRAPARASR
jgi:ABC-type Mn2+/Zn2+ transport system ATPase subunit